MAGKESWLRVLPPAGGRSSKRLGQHFQDNGKGIPESILKELFAPLIRQKEIGTRGLGIAISPIPMNERNGSIFATSEVGKGTIITLSLPNFAVPLQVTLAEQRQLVI